MKGIKILLITFLFTHAFTNAQLGVEKEIFTHEDTLRGSLNPNRTWWDVLRYDITVKPDYNNKSIQAKTTIQFAINKPGDQTMQIDLQQPLIIDSIINNNKHAVFKKIDENEWFVFLKNLPKPRALHEITIYYHGIPREAINPPWDGGWIWKKDAMGRAWMSVACQGTGASVWYPCKDHQSDEPDNGASLSIIVPDTLIAVGNGMLVSKQKNNDRTTTWKWEVKNPINNYNIIPYIGKYVNFNDTLHGEKGMLNLSYWVLDYNLDKAKKEFEQAKPMLHCFEHWFGPYPFYEDGYKLVESPHLGMEHQSAVGYGNSYRNGYFYANKEMIDLSNTGWGFKWDFIIVHESGHEWFGNNITSKDIADMWVHEGITNYSETLYTEWLFGKEAGNEYNYGIRARIKNDEPIIGHYGVNKEGGRDMYYKGGNMMHLIRHSINNDSLFRQILRGLNKTFYHQTVTTQQIENYISKNAQLDFSKVFDQYLRTTQIPTLEYYYTPDKKYISFRWDSCVTGFNLRVAMNSGDLHLTIYPTQKWKKMKLVNDDGSIFFDSGYIEKNYYIRVKQLASRPE